MLTNCIVCLGELAEQNSPSPSSPSTKKEGAPTSTKRNSGSTPNIAHLLPCQHYMHDDCLKPWVDRANSCPICRQIFNEVELSFIVGGPKVTSYAVQDRIQSAEFDPTLIVEEEVEEDDRWYPEEGESEDERPCPICERANDENNILCCDFCETGFHTHCLGLPGVPIEKWYCQGCAARRFEEFGPDETIGPDEFRLPPHCRTRTSRRIARADGSFYRTFPGGPGGAREYRMNRHRYQLNRASRAPWRGWERVWQSVWDHLNFDLDSPDNEEPQLSGYRNSQMARGMDRRAEVAERQGGDTQFFLHPRQARPRPSRRREPPVVQSAETPEETRAWAAMEKAQAAEQGDGKKRKRGSANISPVEDQEPQPVERKLKRPKTRRTLEPSKLGNEEESSASGPSNSNGGPNGSNKASLEEQGHGPSFLQSLLKEVESSSASEDTGSRYRPANLISVTPSADYGSPQFMSSPGSSPTTSNHPTPRAGSNTPPPLSAVRPANGFRPSSPNLLTSRVEPIFPPAEFSPSRSPPPEEVGGRGVRPVIQHRATERRRSRPGRQTSPAISPPDSSDASPTRTNMSMEAKGAIQRMVTPALKSYYRKGDLTTEQYTSINRRVSRILYEKVGDAAILDEEVTQNWEKVAAEEVKQAVTALKPV